MLPCNIKGLGSWVRSSGFAFPLFAFLLAIPLIFIANNGLLGCEHTPHLPKAMKYNTGEQGRNIHIHILTALVLDQKSAPNMSWRAIVHRMRGCD